MRFGDQIEPKLNGVGLAAAHAKRRETANLGEIPQPAMHLDCPWRILKQMG
jgi:hypothetical protein